MYDQVKVDGFKLNFSITSGIGPGGTFPSLTVYTAVDRKLAQNDFAESQTSEPANSHYPVASELRNSSSYLASVALNNSVTKMVRSCYASDLFEKASFADASYHVASLKVNNVASQNVRCLSATDPAFVPCMFFAVDTGSSKDTQNSRDCNVVIEIIYYLTFRNPKYGGAASVSRTIAIPRGPIFPDDDDDMDGDDGVMDDAGDMDPDPAPPPQQRQATTTSSGRVTSAPATSGLDAAPPVPPGSGDSGRHPHKSVVLDRSQRLNV